MFWLIIAILLYLFPAILAHFIKAKHEDAICVLNLLLGWTFVGWVLSLVWAVADDKKDKKC